MRNYIILNGKNSNEINGLLIQELPPISKPQIRTEIEEIDGRDGDIVTKLGFAAYDKEISVGLYKDFDINEIIAYFNSEGTIVFSNEPDKYYNYQIIDQIDFERLVRYRTATIRMHCQPFKYSTTQGTITKDASATVSDEGSNLVLENTAEAPFKRLDPKGNSTQQTYSGKNLWGGFENEKTATILGVQFTNYADGTFKGNGTASGGRAYSMDSATARNNGRILTLPAGTYNLSGGTNTMMVALINSQGQQLYTTTASNHAVSFTLSEQTDCFVRAQVEQGSIVSNETIYPMLVAGATAGDYEPYTGSTPTQLVPSPNPSYPQDVNVVSRAQTVKITGKNLLNDSAIRRIIPSSGSFNRTVPMTIGAGTYSFGAFADGSFCPESNYYVFQFRNGSTPIVASATPSTPMTLTAEEASQVDNMFFHFNANFTSKYSGKQLTAMVCSGSTLGDYEPYKSQSQEINLGKNLIDINSLATTAITVSNGVATGQGQHFYAAYGQNTDGVPFIKMNGQLAISFKAYTDGNVSTANTNGLVVRVVYTDGTSALVIYCKNNEKTAVQHTAVTASGKDVASIQFTYSNDGGNIWHISEFQIEQGQPTSYAPYKTPLELAKINTYQDYIWNDEGTWKIHKETGKVIFDGSETWGQTSNTLAFYRTFTTVALVGNDDIPPVRSDYYTPSTYRSVATAGTVDYGIATHASNPRITIRNKDCADTTAFKAWLSAHNITVYYALATPVDEEITDATLIEQLEALAEAHSYKGRTHINATATGNNAPHIIAAEVGVDNESTVTNSGNINSKPVIKIYGSGNIGAYLNDIQILQIALGDEGYITIDTNLMEAYKDTLDNLKNRLVTGDYSKFSLKPGVNKIHFSGTVTKYEISKYSRWL